MIYLILFLYNLIAALFVGHLFINCTPKNAVTLVVCIASGLFWLPLAILGLIWRL